LATWGAIPSCATCPAARPVVNLALATSSEWKDRDSGDKQQSTEWHRCVAFGKLAELIGEYCKKGSTLYVEGKLKTRKWQDKDGRDNYTTEVVLDEFINMDKRVADQAAAPSPAPSTPAADTKPAAKKARAKASA
jgi:single-strand DNA-binding protein